MQTFDLNSLSSSNEIIFSVDAVKGRWILNISDSFNDSDAVLIITEWKEYFDMDWNRISSYMRRPAWVFDARSVVNPNEVINAGLKLWRIGDGS